MSTRLDSIRERWDDERKISGGDVRWLLERAEDADVLESAMRIVGDGSSRNRDAFLKGLLGRDR